MATGTTALAAKIIGNKPKASKKIIIKKETKKTSVKKEYSPIEYRTKMADGKARKVYKPGSGMIEEMVKMFRSGKTVEAIAKHFGKENKDISWYVSRLKKTGTLPKNFTAKHEGK